MKLLITDLDGTFYPKKSSSSEIQLQRNIEAVKKWIEAGNKFAVATARGLHHYHYLINLLGFDVNFIGSNGAETQLENGQIIIKQMPVSVFIDLCKFIKKNKINASVATGLNDKWVWSSKDCYPKDENLFKPGVWETIEVVDLDSVDLNAGVERIQIFVPPCDKGELQAKIEQMNYSVVVTSSDHNLIDIGPLNSSKGISIMELLDYFEIEQKDLIVVGDSQNDICMFDIAEASYCIDHASNEAKTHAKHSVKSVEEVIEVELKK